MARQPDADVTMSPSEIERRYRCHHYGLTGRCQLRSSIGGSCAWHARVEDGEPNTRDAFNEFLKDEKLETTRWGGRTMDSWWSLLLGEAGDGSWDSRKQQEIRTQTSAPEGGGY